MLLWPECNVLYGIVCDVVCKRSMNNTFTLLQNPEALKNYKCIKIRGYALW